MLKRQLAGKGAFDLGHIMTGKLLIIMIHTGIHNLYKKIFVKLFLFVYACCTFKIESSITVDLARKGSENFLLKHDQ